LQFLFAFNQIENHFFAAKNKQLTEVLKEQKVEASLKEKQRPKKLEIEAKASILPDHVARKKLLDSIASEEIIKLSEETAPVLQLLPANDEKYQTIGELASGNCRSAYPHIDGARQGDPICDRFIISFFPDCTIVAFADGCGWGEMAKKAANTAIDVFTKNMIQMKHEFTTTRFMARMMLRSYLNCHNNIIKGLSLEQIFDAGTTTMLAGIICELTIIKQDDHQPSSAELSWLEFLRGPTRKFVFTFVNLGDCKAYIWNSITGNISDVSEVLRATANDPRDPGGRLGPQEEGGHPDLRNLSAYSVHAQEGDIIFVCSDGVHDNLDPQRLGKSPKSIGLNVDKNSWENVVNHKEASEAKAKWSLNFVSKLLTSKKTQITPELITKTLIEHALQLTESSREFMETNPTQPLPKSKKIFGKNGSCILCLNQNWSFSSKEQIIIFLKKNHIYSFLL